MIRSKASETRHARSIISFTDVVHTTFYRRNLLYFVIRKNIYKNNSDYKTNQLIACYLI